MKEVSKKNFECDGIIFEVYSPIESQFEIINEYFDYLRSEYGRNNTSKKIEIHCSFSRELYFEILEKYERRNNLKIVPFHPDTDYVLFYKDEFESVYMSVGGINHLVVKNSTESRIEIVIPYQNRESLEHLKPSLRIMREIFFRYNEESGAFMLHSSACQYKNKGVVFCGENGAGKTTLAANLGKEIDGYFISSDRLLINRNNEICGWPGGISVTDRTLQNLFNDRVGKFSKIHSDNFLDNGKKLFTPKEFSSIFNLDFVAKCKLNMFIFPQFKINKTEEMNSIRKLSSSEVLIKLTDQLCTPDCNLYRYGLIEIRTQQSFEIRKSMIERLAFLSREIPAYELNGHPDYIFENLKMILERS